MKFKRAFLLYLVLILIAGSIPFAYASPDIDGQLDIGSEVAYREDNKKDPLTTKQLDLKEKALEAKLHQKKAGKVVETAKGQYVELEREGEHAIWTVLGEFNDYTHNSIAEPDRTEDNTTIWVDDFGRDYYMDILFNDAEGANSMFNFYIEQSSGRFSVYGDVTDWVKVPGGYADYDDDPDSNVWLFLADSVDGWYNMQIDAGKTPDEINEYLSQFDVWDRYDYDGDGNFDEPDGYIDTFQSVHAGEGEEAGGGTLGSAAIWSHSWYAHSDLIGIAGPDDNLSGGIQIGESDYWVGKYTIQPENGGVGVFAHEFGHDIGLPDLYDYYGENGTGFWTLMSSGSWLSDGTVDIGSKPNHMGAWEKFQMGWLNYEVAFAGEKSTHRLGPMEFNTKQAQGLFVILPPKAVTEEIGTPYSGEYAYYSDAGNDLDTMMFKEFDLPVTSTLSAQVNYSIEAEWDYAYVVISTDGGATWTPLDTNLSTDDNPYGQNFGHGITGASAGWVPLTADLSAYDGMTVMLGFRYWTDGAVVESGIMIDDIEVTGSPLDDAETGGSWTFEGFRRTTGTESGFYSNYYVCEYKTYSGYNSTLEVGPYNFGYPDYPNLVDHFAYKDGLLIHYWDTSQTDNNTGLHPGQGLLLPIDAHFEPLYRFDGGLWRNRIQTYDSTFSLSPTGGIPNLHFDGVHDPVESLPGVGEFNDLIDHYSEENPLGSVKHPNTGTVIRILQEPNRQVRNSQPPFMQIQVAPVK